ncbi:hypothetical protein RVN83_01200 [Streptomyces sp. PU10]|uniref:hypothetical protein n=1 Tax=unclassified Streptomyces TaxID=2593676 RepID=UPI00106EB109|nr:MULTISPECIES: hypothetical protein [unclassified Streptomyces]MDU0251936.1 hypothetical protein [Streptomyces sp. PU10]
MAQLTVEVGTSTYLLPSGRPELIRTFAEEVAPATRELVSAARARGDEPRTSRTSGGVRAPSAAAGHWFWRGPAGHSLTAHRHPRH